MPSEILDEWLGPRIRIEIEDFACRLPQELINLMRRC
jgi:hypothetical protein